MGGLWVDYELQTTIPGLFAIGEANFLRPRRQPPRRALGLMSARPTVTISPHTVTNHLPKTTSGQHFRPAFDEVENDVRGHVPELMDVGGSTSVARPSIARWANT